MAERHSDAGSTLLLLPSAVLVLFLLAALSVDGAATFLAQRELADVCASAANDAATTALTPDRLFGPTATESRAIDLDRAASVTRSRLAPLDVRWGRPATLKVEAADSRIILRLEASVPLPIGPGGGSRARTRVNATCEATTIRR